MFNAERKEQRKRKRDKMNTAPVATKNPQTGSVTGTVGLLSTQCPSLQIVLMLVELNEVQQFDSSASS